MRALRLPAALRLVATGLVAAAVMAGRGGAAPASARPAGTSRRRVSGAAATSTTASTSTTTVPPTTTTTVDPGTLPQTMQLPSAYDPAFRARIADLWQAVTTGDAASAAPAFFPLSAYIQVKGISDPVHDYDTRLIPDYDQDIATLHGEIGPSAVFRSVSVPDAAEWILPGVEYNKGSYWRVYGTRVYFTVGTQLHYFTIASMISWRGQWYVVHLLSIR